MPSRACSTPSRRKSDAGGCVIKVLVVDDSALVRKLFGRVLRDGSGLRGRSSRATGSKRWRSSRSSSPTSSRSTSRCRRWTAWTASTASWSQRPCPVVMVSSLTAEGAEATLEALRLGAVDFVAKPAGAVSLRIDEFAPSLVEKVRAAAGAKLPASRRLKERVAIASAAAPRRCRRPRTADARQKRRPAAEATGSCWSAPPPAARRRSKRCCAAAGRLSVADPGRPAHAGDFTGPWPGASTASARSAWSRSRAPMLLQPGTRLHRPRRCRHRRLAARRRAWSRCRRRPKPTIPGIPAPIGSCAPPWSTSRREPADRRADDRHG